MCSRLAIGHLYCGIALVVWLLRRLESQLISVYQSVYQLAHGEGYTSKGDTLSLLESCKIDVRLWPLVVVLIEAQLSRWSLLSEEILLRADSPNN